jgi:uncharacterized protein
MATIVGPYTVRMSRAAIADPRKLDLDRWCRAGTALQGELPWAALPRLAEAQSVLPPQDGVSGAQRPEWRMGLRIQGRLRMTCQRCLHPMVIAVQMSRAFRFVADEAEAEALDEAAEDEDVLVLSRAFDLPALVEDELILSLPLVPRHAQCPVDVQSLLAAADTPAGPAAAEEPPATPFAVLAALKR